MNTDTDSPEFLKLLRGTLEDLVFDTEKEMPEELQDFPDWARVLDDLRRELSHHRGSLNIHMQLLQATRERLDAILRCIKDGIIVTDKQNGIIKVNPTVEMLWQKSEGEVLGEYIWNCDDNAKFTEVISKYLLQILDGEELEIVEEVEYAFGGNFRIFRVLMTPIISLDQSELLGVVTVLHDITRAKEVEAMKDAFLSMVSHELRTPLTSIIAYTDTLLADDTIDAETRGEFLGVIQGEGKRLLDLINDILDIAKIESGKMSYELIAVDVAELLTRSVRTVGVLAQEKNVEIRVPADSFPSIIGDIARLQQVVVNLLSNAIKFSPAQSEIFITIEQVDDFLKLSIRDQGCGIPEDYRAVVFEKFKQVDTGNHRTVSGTGLGLPICREIVRAHSGEIQVESKENEGSTFWFTIPLVKKGS